MNSLLQAWVVASPFLGFVFIFSSFTFNFLSIELSILHFTSFRKSRMVWIRGMTVVQLFKIVLFSKFFLRISSFKEWLAFFFSIQLITIYLLLLKYGDSLRLTVDCYKSMDFFSYILFWLTWVSSSRNYLFVSQFQPLMSEEHESNNIYTWKYVYS